MFSFSGVQWQPNVLTQRRSVWKMMTRTVLCLPVLTVPSVGRWEFQFMSPVAVTQLTGNALMMESMLLVSSARGTCATWLMQQLSVANCVTQHSTSLAWRLLPTFVGVNAIWFERLCHINGVQWLEEAVQTPDVHGTLCCEPTVPDDSIAIPCCQHGQHVSCFSRSLCSSRPPLCSMSAWWTSSFHHPMGMCVLPLLPSVDFQLSLVSCQTAR